MLEKFRKRRQEHRELKKALGISIMRPIFRKTLLERTQRGVFEDFIGRRLFDVPLAVFQELKEKGSANFTLDNKPIVLTIEDGRIVGHTKEQKSLFEKRKQRFMKKGSEAGFEEEAGGQF